MQRETSQTPQGDGPEPGTRAWRHGNRVKQDSNGAPKVLDARDRNKRAGGEQQAETGQQARTQKKATICMHHYEQPSQRGQAMRNKLYSNGPSAAARFVTEKFCTALPESVHTYGIALQKEATAHRVENNP